MAPALNDNDSGVVGRTMNTDEPGTSSDVLLGDPVLCRFCRHMQTVIHSCGAPFGPVPAFLFSSFKSSTGYTPSSIFPSLSIHPTPDVPNPPAEVGRTGRTRHRYGEVPNRSHMAQAER